MKNAPSFLFAGLAGALFGAGLLVSGLVQPARIVGFLDVTGKWDPTLIFVMIGAVAVYGIAFRWIRRLRPAPWFDFQFHWPTRRDLDAPLIVGSAVFGIGWGLAGLCPGPGIVSAASGSFPSLVFVAAMIVGMLVQHRVSPKQEQPDH